MTVNFLQNALKQRFRGSESLFFSGAVYSRTPSFLLMNVIKHLSIHFTTFCPGGLLISYITCHRMPGNKTWNLTDNLFSVTQFLHSPAYIGILKTQMRIRLFLHKISWQHCRGDVFLTCAIHQYCIWRDWKYDNPCITKSQDYESSLESL